MVEYSGDARRGDLEGTFGVRFCGRKRPATASSCVFGSPEEAAGEAPGGLDDGFSYVALLLPKVGTHRNGTHRLANDTDVIYLSSMRQCAKMRCEEPAAATVALRYAERVVWIRDLLSRHDPNLLDLCAGHADRLTPPLNWRRLDEREDRTRTTVVPELASP